MSGLFTFLKNKPLSAAIMVVTLLVAIYLRFNNIQNEFHFMGDQGRDALIASRIFTDHNLVFVGPVMSVGNIYLGPFYYYFMVPFLWLSYPSPIGPVIAVAVFNVITVFLLYLLGRKLVGEKAGLLAAVMMSISAVAVYHSRFSWNPNIVPFVSLLMIFWTYLAWKKDIRYWLLVGISMGILIQLHYVTLLAGAAAGLVWLFQLYSQRKDSSQVKQIVIWGVVALLSFISLLSPLLLFDYKHNWSNVKALGALFSDEENFSQSSTAEAKDWVAAPAVVLDTTKRIVLDKYIGDNGWINNLVLVSIMLLVTMDVRSKMKQKKDVSGVLIVSTFALVGVIGFSFYEHQIYDHYVAFLLPAVFLLIGLALQFLVKKHWAFWCISAAFLVFFARYNIDHITFRAGGPTQKELQSAADSIHNRVGSNEPYAIVLLSESHDLYGMNYRYFLNTQTDKKPVDSEEFGKAQKLFIINEEQATDRPQDLPIYEIVTFENKEPIEVYTLPQGISVTVLAKNSKN